MLLFTKSERRRQMILVDVYVPAMDDNYDFMVDENVAVGQIVTEIGGMISK